MIVNGRRYRSWNNTVLIRIFGFRILFKGFYGQSFGIAPYLKE